MSEQHIGKGAVALNPQQDLQGHTASRKRPVCIRSSAAGLIGHCWRDGTIEWDSELLTIHPPPDRPPHTVVPRPVQRPGPPIYLVGISDSTLQFGAERGFPLLLAAAQPVPLVRRTQERYYSLLVEQGHDPALVSLPLNRFIYVGETDQHAEDALRDAVLTFIGRPDSTIRDFLGLRPEEITYERLLEDVFIVGSAGRCAEKILALGDELDVRDLVLTFNYFTLDHEQCLASMRRFVDEVRPTLPEPQPLPELSEVLR